MKQLLGALAVALVLCGCASDDLAAQTDPVQVAFKRRAPMHSCGKTELPQGSASVMPAAMTNCLQTARARHETAEARITQRTTEGDPIVTYLRVRADGTFEFYVDSTKDKFGLRQWQYSDSNCSATDPLLQQICSPAG
ncbi:DUF4362 domain-containing protein [Flexivirga meconopsidis]|uniref:DUF4362 domain-containing protein n=1 Tax=Flexivirga meconopsidis TaxID=2977121 RepID=UPI00223FCBC0